MMDRQQPAAVPVDFDARSASTMPTTLSLADAATALESEQLELLCRHARRSLLPAVVAAVFTAWIVWDKAPAWLTLPLAVVYIVLSVVRTVFARRTLRDPQRDVRASLRFFVLLAIGTGICMGLVPLLFFGYLDLLDQAILTVVQVGIAAGGVATTAGYRPAFLVAAPVNLISLSLGWLLWGQGKSMILALLPLFLGWMLITFATQYEQLVRRRFAEESEKNQALAALQQEKVELQIARDAANEASAAAREANLAKSRFLAAASHDLRQPLHALMLFLGSLESHVHGDEARTLHRRVSFTAGVLEEQFNSLLDLSKFDADVVKPDPTVFRFDALLNELKLEIEPQARQKGLVLAVSAPAVMVHTDMLLIERLLRNLLSNAVRFTERGSVTVICESTGAGLRVAVVDTGPGIAPDDQDRIFGEFVQLDNPARRRDKGVGLGLAIAQRISNVLGVELTLTSAVGLGSRFEFVIPTVQAPAKAERAAADSVQIDDQEVTLTGCRVLIVDDDPLVCEALSQQFQVWGVEAMFVESLEEVRAIARAGAPIDVALIDDMLGKAESGLEIARWLAAESPGLRISILTGNTRPERLAELRQSGLPVLLKPLPPHRLREILARRLAVQQDLST